MTACPNCSGFDERIHLERWEYESFARQLIDFVSRGIFLKLRASTPLEKLANGIWHGDAECNEFLCSACDRHFKLSADTYHGRASWNPDPQPPESTLNTLIQ